MPSNSHHYITLTRSHPLCTGFIEVPTVAILGVLFIYYWVTNHPQNLVIWNNKYLLSHIFCQEFERALARWVWIRVYQDFNHVGQVYNHLKAWLKPEDLPRWLFQDGSLTCLWQETSVPHQVGLPIKCPHDMANAPHTHREREKERKKGRGRDRTGAGTEASLPFIT